MYAYERTAPAAAVCLALVVVAFGLLFIANFEWPTSRIVRSGFAISENDILVYDVLPIIVAGFVIGLVAIAITRFIFPRSSIKVVLYVVGACAGLATLPLLWLSAAIGARNIRDLGAVGDALRGAFGNRHVGRHFFVSNQARSALAASGMPMPDMGQSRRRACVRYESEAAVAAQRYRAVYHKLTIPREFAGHLRRDRAGHTRACVMPLVTKLVDRMQATRPVRHSPARGASGRRNHVKPVRTCWD
jgi:hypothetical protein